MKNLFFISSSLILVGGCTSQQGQKPNVIIILADDLGFGDVSAYGSKTINTPNMDRLANGGICFTNGYATSATSTPSRYALMTGMYPWKNKDAKILAGDAPLLIREDQYTLPKLMLSAGYATGAIGKWHLGMGSGNVDWNQTVRPCANEIGFQYSCLIAATNDRVPTVYVENGNVVGLNATDSIFVNYEHNFEGEPTALSNPEMLKMPWAHGHNNSIVNGIPRIGYMKGGKSAQWKDEDMADYFVSKMKKFISGHKDTPFFLYYGLHQPHVPRAPHQRFVGATTMGARGDAIIEADWCVGELMAHLEKEGILDNTLIIFSSDNGPVLNDGYKDGALEMVGSHQPAGGLRGGKYSLFDGGTHVPFFAYWNGHINPKKSNALVCHMDIMASLADLLNISLPEKMDSESHLEGLLGKSKQARRKLVIEAQGRLAYRCDEWVILPPYKGAEMNLTGNELGNLGEYGLYNLSNDFGQQDNLASVHPTRLDSMQSDFFKIVEGYYRETIEEEPLK